MQTYALKWRYFLCHYQACSCSTAETVCCKSVIPFRRKPSVSALGFSSSVPWIRLTTHCTSAPRHHTTALVLFFWQVHGHDPQNILGLHYPFQQKIKDTRIKKMKSLISKMNFFLKNKRILVRLLVSCIWRHNVIFCDFFFVVFVWFWFSF